MTRRVFTANILDYVTDIDLDPESVSHLGVGIGATANLVDWNATPHFDIANPFGAGTGTLEVYPNGQIIHDDHGDTSHHPAPGGVIGYCYLRFIATDGRGGYSTVKTGTLSLTGAGVGDVTDPTFVSMIPPVGATGVSTTINPVLTFSEDLQQGTGTLEFHNVTDNTTVSSLTLPTDAGSGDGKVNVLDTDVLTDPAGGLPAGKRISIRYPAGFVKDLAGRNCPAVTDDSIFFDTLPAGGGGGSLAFFIPRANARARRAEIVLDHFPGTGAEQEFTGFNDLDLLTFTVQTAVSYADLIAKINAVGVNSKVIIECAWNGVSQSAAAINGTNKNQLTANGAVDYGYTRHGQKILVRPAAGYAPAVQGTANSAAYGNVLTFVNGINFIEWRGMIFDGMVMRHQTSSTYPTLGIVAIKNCITQNCGADVGAFWNVTSGGASLRVFHMEGTVETNNRCGTTCAANWFRRWNCVDTEHRDNDWNAIRGFAGVALGWRARVWIAGNFLYSPSQTLNLASGQHLDFAQVSTQASAGNVAEHDILIEFNIGYLNRPGTAGGPQATFGDDGTIGKFEWMVHNNLWAIGAYEAIKPFDPSNDGRKFVFRNTCVRKGNGPGYNSSNPSVRNDTCPSVEGLARSPGTGVGFLEMYDNIFCTSYSQTGKAYGENIFNNLNCDPRKSAAVGVRMQDTFVGNGSWYQSAGDAMWQYDIGDQGDTPASAKSKIRDFFVPKRFAPGQTGYSTADGHYGMTDPNGWPTDFRTLA